MHPDLIPRAVGCIFPEPVEPFVDGEPLLFLRASEIIHSALASPLYPAAG
jgi:hypothetical protein